MTHKLGRLKSTFLTDQIYSLDHKLNLVAYLTQPDFLISNKIEQFILALNITLYQCTCSQNFYNLNMSVVNVTSKM